jgi:Ca2+-binding RTX toxin-like protein
VLKLGDDSASTGVGFADGKTLSASWTTTSSASDAVTVNLGRAYVAGSVTAVTPTTSLSGVTLSLPGIENITLTQSALTNGTAFGLKIQDTNTNNVSITVNGGLASRALNLVSGALQSNVTTISATNFAGDLVMNASARSGSGAMDITGGSGSDTIVMKNASDSLVGGSGNDTLILSVAGNDRFTFDLSAADQVVVWNGDSNAAIQSGFENLDAGGIIGSTLGVKVLGAAAAGSSITGTSYSDTINGGTGNDTITGGDGVDYIDVSIGSSSRDQVVFTARGQTLNSNKFSSAEITNGTFLGVTGVLGIDLITGVARGDTIKLYGSASSLVGFDRGFSTTGLIGGSSTTADGSFQMSKGSFIGTGLWTFSASGNDVLFQWDADGSGVGSEVESVVLIGSASAFTGITANSAGVILFT